MPTMIEKLGIDRMTVAERKALVRELWVSLPEEERILPVGVAPAPTGTELAHDEWMRRLRSAASDCGVSLSNEALSSEGLYD